MHETLTEENSQTGPHTGIYSEMCRNQGQMGGTHSSSTILQHFITGPKILARARVAEQFQVR